MHREVARAFDRIREAVERTGDRLKEDAEIFGGSVGDVTIDAQQAEDQKIGCASEPNARERGGPPHATRISVAFSSPF